MQRDPIEKSNLPDLEGVSLENLRGVDDSVVRLGLKLMLIRIARRDDRLGPNKRRHNS